jgi:hypothetical protein
MGKAHVRVHPLRSEAGWLSQHRLKLTRLSDGSSEDQHAAKPVLTVSPGAQTWCFHYRRNTTLLNDLGKGHVALVPGVIVFSSGSPALQDQSREWKPE